MITSRPILFLVFANDRDDRARYLRNGWGRSGRCSGSWPPAGLIGGPAADGRAGGQPGSAAGRPGRGPRAAPGRQSRPAHPGGARGQQQPDPQRRRHPAPAGHVGAGAAGQRPGLSGLGSGSRPAGAGYRVYRAGGDGVSQPMGGSFAPGHVDLTAAVGARTRMRSPPSQPRGSESPLSQGVYVGVPGLRIYLPLVGHGAGRP